MKKCRMLLSLLLALCLVVSIAPGAAFAAGSDRSVHSGITLDENPADGYEGDYVVIYNPDTTAESARSTGDMTGLIDTTISPNVTQRQPAGEKEPYVIDVDDQMARLAEKAGIETPSDLSAKRDTATNYHVGDTMDFEIYAPYSPTGSGTVEFKCLYVGEHCYIWTPTLDNGVTYPLDTLGADFAEIAAAEFDSKFDLMQSSFGEHLDFETGDNRLHMLYYNINEGWQPGQGYIAGFFYATDLYKNYLPILNIDTYPGVIYPNYYGEGKDWLRTDSTYHTMVHEYQHLINFSNNYMKGNMHSWLNESFSAAAEEICYPGSSVIPRIQSWENYFYTNDNDWLSPPAEFEYQSSYNMHNGYSLYDWDTDMSDVLALYAQVSMFSQYLYTRFGNGIYRQINDVFEAKGQEPAAISAATGVDCSELAKEFRVAVTANAALDQYDGIYGFQTQEGYDPAQYHDMENPWNLLGPVVFTGASCSIKGGGAITIKPVGGVYNPPADADPGLVYVGIKLAPRPEYTVSFSVCGSAEDSQTTLANDSITLPSAVGVTVEGWSFAGWAERDVAQTTEAPDFFLPGAEYAVTDNATLYALFTRASGDDTLYRTDPVTTHTPVLIPAVLPACTTAGNVAYYQCSECGKYFAEESCETETTPEGAAIAATGHVPGESVTENEETPGCTAVGGFDTVVYCVVCGEELSRDHTEIPATGHTPGTTVKENEVPPACAAVGGYDSVIYCTVCGAELARWHTEIAALGHVPGEPAKENDTAPGCVEPGGYDMVVRCTVCKEILESTHTEIPAIGHDWGEPTYTWADDNSSVVASRKCKNDPSHEETELAPTTFVVTKEATLEEEGEIVYTATFFPEAFETQTKTVVIPKLEKPAPVNPFEDVKEGAFYYDAVLWAVNAKPQVTSGTSKTTFNPTATCTRGQVVTFLWRAKGSPEPTKTDNPFEDVDAKGFYYKAVLWAVENNITSGLDKTHFGPANGCTRGQVVTFLWRTQGKPNPTSTDTPFTDVDAKGFYYKAMCWAVENKITTGTGKTTFAPENTCTRGQIVTFLYRALAT